MTSDDLRKILIEASRRTLQCAQWEKALKAWRYHDKTTLGDPLDGDDLPVLHAQTRVVDGNDLTELASLAGKILDGGTLEDFVEIAGLK